jgi:hypothetical protein
MKVYQKWLLAICAILMLVVCIPHKAEASGKYDYKITKLKQGKWANAKKTTYSFDSGKFTIRLQKITVPANGYVKINFKKKGTELAFYKTINQDRLDNERVASAVSQDDKVCYLVLPKGTYYIGPYTSYEGKYRWSFIKSPTPSNTKKARAKPLASGKNERIVFNYGKKSNRWYKINVKNPKKITVYVKNSLQTGDAVLHIYDSNGKSIFWENVYGKREISEFQTGTYYVEVCCPTSAGNKIREAYERYIEFSWK